MLSFAAEKVLANKSDDAFHFGTKGRLQTSLKEIEGLVHDFSVPEEAEIRYFLNLAREVIREKLFLEIYNEQ